MTSAELRRQKQEFIRNVDAFTEKYNGLTTVINDLNSYLTSTEDTMLNNELLSKSDSIANTINKTVNAVQSKKAAAIAKIDTEIRRLEELERKAREKALEEKGVKNELL